MLASFIAKIGVNPTFIAFQAHCWFAFSVVSTCGRYSVPVVLVSAALKEFWFDAKYEVPAQTWKDNTLDFAGYTTGALLALSLYLLHS